MSSHRSVVLGQKSSKVSREDQLEDDLEKRQEAEIGVERTARGMGRAVSKVERRTWTVGGQCGAATPLTRPSLTRRRSMVRSVSPLPRFQDRMRFALRPLFLPPRLRTFSALFFATSRTPRLPRFFASMAALTTVNTSARLQALRELMEKPEYNVQALVMPTEDQRKYPVFQAASGFACDRH